MNEFNVATALVCPNCGRPIEHMGAVTPGHSKVVRKGQITVCAACCAPSIVGDSGLEALNESRFKTLDARTQEAVRLTVQAVRQMVGDGPSKN